jgi:uncharacterized protein (TIGR03086 family)
MSELDVLRTAFAQTQEAVDGLREGDLQRPTPCTEWDVRALLVHVVAAHDGLVALLHGEQADWGRDALGDDPAGAVRRSTQAALAAWAEPGAVDTPSQQMPGMRVVDFAMADAAAHGWDLATALGRRFALDDADVEVLSARWTEQAAETGRTYGVFGPRVDVPVDAPALDRVLGLFGRDPSRTASGGQPPRT